ncbi:MAG: glycine cleavage system protein GcvH [Rhizobiaceae bacterium]
MSTVHYTADHEWIRVEGSTATVGITPYAQEQLGDLVYVGLPTVGQVLAKGSPAVTVESVKAASDVYAPVAGTVTAVNDLLGSEPGLINSDPLAQGWLWTMTLADPGDVEGLMDEAAYLASIG